MSKKFQPLLVSSTAVRNSAAKVISLEEGAIFDLVEQDLQDRLGDNPDDYRSICSTSRCLRLDYCQSKLDNQVAVPTSLISINQVRDPNKTRVPRLWGSINHDFVVVHMTGQDSKGKEHKFSIVAEKGGAGQAGELPGIHLGLLREADLQFLHNNIFISWDCLATQVPLDILTKKLWEDQSPTYNFLDKNCWDYSQATCKNIFLLLSKQPTLALDQKRYFEERADEVKGSVVLKAVVETSGRGAMYAGLIMAGTAIAYGLGSLMPAKKTEAEKSTDADKDKHLDGPHRI